MPDRSPVQNIINGLHERNLLDVARVAARDHHVTLDELLGRRRTKQIVKARHALVRTLCAHPHELASSYVGELLRMDHTSVLNAKNKGQSTP